MDDQESLDIYSTSNNESNKRPVFLTVLCVLTFVSVGYSLLSGLSGLMSGEASQEAIELAIEQVEEGFAEFPEELDHYFEGFVEFLNYSNDNLYRITLTALVFSLMKLIGALLMWKLDKRGFVLYALADVAQSLHLVILIPNIITYIFLGFSGFLTVAFVAMYAANLKHMK